MIKFKTTTAEIERLARSFPNLKLVLDALEEHEEIKFIIDDEDSESPVVKPANDHTASDN